MKSLFDRRATIWIAWLTLAIELVCIVLRFGFGQTSAVATASTIGALTFGVRVHHGYIGLLMLLLGLGMFEFRPKFSRILFIVGVALFLSDMIHHFLILWPITGNHYFDLFYPTVEGALEREGFQTSFWV